MFRCVADAASRWRPIDAALHRQEVAEGQFLPARVMAGRGWSEPHFESPMLVGGWVSWPNSVQGFYRIQIAMIGPALQGNVEVSFTGGVIAECMQ